MLIIGRAVEMRVGERFALPISVLAMMSAPAAVIVIREKTKQPEQKSSSCFYVFGIAEIIASGKRYLRYDNTDTCKNVCKLTGCSGSGWCG